MVAAFFLKLVTHARVIMSSFNSWLTLQKHPCRWLPLNSAMDWFLTKTMGSIIYFFSPVCFRKIDGFIWFQGYLLVSGCNIFDRKSNSALQYLISCLYPPHDVHIIYSYNATVTFKFVFDRMFRRNNNIICWITACIFFLLKLSLSLTRGLY